MRSGLPFGTCLTTSYLHPDNDTKRYFTYRNRGFLMNQPGMRRLLPQEYARFAWFFLVQNHDVKGFREWLSLQSKGRAEKFFRP